MNLVETEKTPEQKDVEYLQKQLEKTHFDLYRNINKETFSESLKKATKTDPQYFKIALQESLALIGDAHTYVTGMLDDEYIPIDCKEINGKYFIIGSSPQHSLLLCQEIQRINGHILDEVSLLISKLSSNENGEVLKKDIARYMTSNLVLKYYGLSKEDVITIGTNVGETEINSRDKGKVRRINPLKWRADEKKDPTHVGNDLYHYRIVGNTLLFQYKSCSNEGHTSGELKSFQKNLLQQSKSVESIVVDLRLNRGGNTSIMENLFKNLPNEKKIYVAIGRDTFSSAMHHLLYLKTEKGAVLIGENAGQKPNRFGDSKEIVLPNSKIIIQSSFKYFELLPGQNIDVIEPDIKIPVTIEDYIKNRDPLNKWIKDNL